jgi:M6 family metalloprotease-like protein
LTETDPAANVSGVQHIVVLLVEFSNLQHTVDSRSIGKRFADMNSYYQNVSYGKISLDLSIIGWYTLNNTLEFYGEDVVQGLPPSERGDLLLTDSIERVQNETDLSQYRHVAVVHAGPDERVSNRTSDLWPFYWPKYALRVATENGAFYVSEFAGLGTYAHEFGHSLGLPDLYPRDSTKPSLVGVWSLMDSGAWLGDPKESSPSGLDAWSLTQLGWIEPTWIIPGPTATTLTIFALETWSGTRVLKIALKEDLYYLIDLRMQKGVDVALPFDALSVWLVNSTALDPTRPYNGYGVVNSTGKLWAYPCGSTAECTAPFEDNAHKVFIELVDCDTDQCTLLFGSLLIHVILNVPPSIDLPSPFEMTLSFLNTEDRTVPGLDVTVALDGQNIPLVTDERGQIHYTHWFYVPGKHRVEIVTPVIVWPPLQEQAIEVRISPVLLAAFVFIMILVALVIIRRRKVVENALV